MQNLRAFMAIKRGNSRDIGKRTEANQGVRIAERLPQLMLRALGDSQLQLATLISIWPGIIGDELAPYCYPAKWQAGRGALPPSVTLAVQSGFAPLVQMQSPQITAAMRSQLSIPTLTLKFVQF